MFYAAAMIRRGPRPLSLHITMAGAEAARGEIAPEDMLPMVQGIQEYQKHPYTAERSAREIVWQQGSVTLQRIVSSNAKAAPLLLIPSLINDASILDLCGERSLACFLGQGADVYIIDWGSLCDDKTQDSLGMIIAERLVPAAQGLQEITGKPVNALGYCMGGTMLTAAAQIAPDAFDRLVFLASPWDFDAGEQQLTRRVKFWAPQTMPRVKEKGFLPSDWVQGLFASLDPDLAQKKFAKFARMDQDSAEARLFVAVEDWINSGPDIPAGVAWETINGWFLKNHPGKGKWQVGDMVIDPTKLPHKALVVASSQDKLVDYDSAMVLAQLLPNAASVDPACGHISVIAGRKR
ncbi:MAG: alpha/beta fold hydrolase [Alphaproteobacteria bacterium]|nr:alpha/beta fold hydrolase [Alphaproteobacteria bacterium]